MVYVDEKFYEFVLCTVNDWFHRHARLFVRICVYIFMQVAEIPLLLTWYGSIW